MSHSSPEQLRLGSPGRDVRFVLRSDLVALHGSRTRAGASPALLSLPGAGIEVVAARDIDPSETRRRGPVYAQEATESLAIPTGRVFVRFAAEGRPVDWLALIEQHGFRPVADHAAGAQSAWVEPASGAIEAGLAGLGPLAALSGVAGAEPELLRESRRR